MSDAITKDEAYRLHSESGGTWGYQDLDQVFRIIRSTAANGGTSCHISFKMKRDLNRVSKRLENLGFETYSWKSKTMKIDWDC